MPISFSLKEAAVLADVPERVVRKAIEARTIRPNIVVVGSARRYRFHARDLFLLKAVTAFPLPLERKDKEALRDIIKERVWVSGNWHRSSDGDDIVVTGSGGVTIRIQIKPLRSALVRRLKTYHRGRRRVVSNPAVLDGEPVFEGTRIPLAHIAGLVAKNVPIEDIAEDYPALSPDDLQFAAMVAHLKPNPGRPRKPLTLLRNDQPVTTRDRPVVTREAPAR